MSRIRSIHPGLFTDEAFVVLSPMARIFFMGLWTECDDYGSFEWSPLKLKMRLLPADTADANALLEEIERERGIIRYEIGGRTYGAVRNFCQYQRPKKPTSVHPQNDEVRAWVNTEARSTRDGSEGVGNQLPTGGEKPRQMEDGGGSRRPVPTKVETGGKTRGRAPTPEVEIPDWVPDEPWAAFVAMRKAKKKPLSDYAAKQLLGKLRTIHEAGWSLEDVINKAVVNQNDGFWLPDGKDPNIRRAVPPANDQPKTAEWHDEQEAFFVKINRDDEAQRHRAAAAKLRGSTGPPRSIGSIVAQATSNLRAPH